MKAPAKKLIKKIGIGLIAILIIFQFFTIDKSVPEYAPTDDFIYASKPPEDIKVILKSACYDCHSFETKYPWYSSIAPVSWWVKDHINEGRKELNFSAWETSSLRRKDHKLDELIELVEENEMPLTSYTIAHSEARLSEEQRESLIAWVKEFRSSLNYVPPTENENESREEKSEGSN